MIPGTNIPAAYFLGAGAVTTLKMVPRFKVGDIIARIPKKKALRLKILQVVYLVLLIYLKQESQKMLRFMLRFLE